MIDLSNYLAKTKPDKTIKEHTQDLIDRLDRLYNLGYINDELYKLTKKACHYHDYGKANSAFQARIKNGKKFDPKDEVPHNILSMYFVNQDDLEEEDYYRVAEVVLNHHSYGDSSKIIEENKDLINRLLKEFDLDISKAQGRKLRKIKNMLHDEKAMILKGYLHRCDYSASADVEIEYKNDFLLTKLEEMLEGWKLKASKVGEAVDWKPLQKYCKENADSNLIVTAQTGMGKTEAGLLWIGDNKGFFILPIRTAINAIYDRIKGEVLKKENYAKRVALLHSENLSYYAREKAEDEKEEVDSISPLEYRVRSKQLSMPVTVSTLDQLFDFVFKYPGFEMKLTTLSYSKIVIDEIQMYSADLLAYLIYGISMIVKYGGKVAILTATLPPFIRDLLVDKGFNQDVKEACFTDDNLARHKLKVHEEELNPKYIIEKYKENRKLKKGNKILVVCNTVKNAQKIYEELKEEISAKELHILHNKLIKKDRALREEEIKLFGKTFDINGNIDIQNGVWIATSIVEASLDIDFDYLYTELSDLNGLFQRLGRCNRKGKKGLEDYNCNVFTEINKNLLVNGDRGFIDRDIYECSKEALKEITEDGILTEKDKMDLIDKYFTTEKLRKSNYMKNFKSTWEYIDSLNINEVDKSDSQLRNIMSNTVIPAPVYLENKKEITSSLEALKNKDTSLVDKISHKEDIMKYTLSVEPYVVRDFKEECLELSKWERIYIIDCEYTEIGFKTKEKDGFTFW
ncbi:CRISPR-associated helicase Cas3' [Peptostreptococcaceae bacterium OttesenSCG-928-C18]|nr:CRISPR-associated helicase Cas3' [Peptostreptococcaceae bacterium OttesenSCG-928-C18]